MKHLFFTLFTFFATYLVASGQQTEQKGDFDRLRQFASNIISHNNQFTQEKVYLHLDNNGYLPDEEIWFKAYVFKATSLLPTDMSKVLYVELLNPNGQIVERKTLPITNGRTYGNFKPDPLIMRSGYYEVRAYTRAMLNWDDSYIFSRVIPIFQAPQDTIHYRDLAVEPHQYETRTLGYNRTEPKPLIDSCSQKKHSTILAFYPEGGYITQGQEARVAFRLTDADGLPEKAGIEVFATDGTKVTESQILHDGMGAFSLPATWSGGYASFTDAKNRTLRFDLPQARPSGCDLAIDAMRSDSLVIGLHSSADMRGQLIGISGTCRGALCYFDTIRLQATNRLSIDRSKLRGGIIQLTAFTPEGEILSERLAWNAPRQAPPTLTIKQNQDTYGPFQPIVLDISLSDSEGKPLQSDFSLAVRDADTEVAPDAHGLMTDMLLASDLKGYIHNPEYYFAATDDPHTRDLDLLLMVQGWRRYSWQEMAGIDTLQLKQPIEEGLLFKAKLKKQEKLAKKDASKGKTPAPLNVNFVMMTQSKARYYTEKCQPNGDIVAYLPDFYGDASTVITTTDAADKRQEADFVIDRSFFPTRRPYEPAEIERRPPIEDVRIQAVAQPAETFEWQDTIPDFISTITELEGAKISAKRERHYYPGARFAWLGGKDAFKQSATYYYDLIEELDRFKDNDNYVPNVWDWLATVNPNFDYIPAVNEKAYRGRVPIIKVDNDETEGNKTSIIDETWMMNDYSAMAIVENFSVVNNTTNDELKPGQAMIVLYSRNDVHQAPTYSKGTRWINLHGYSRCNEFFSPDYRLTDMPDLSDHRRTLYWAPELMTDTEGKANIIFYSNANDDQRLHINAQGIAINGQMFGN